MVLENVGKLLLIGLLVSVGSLKESDHLHPGWHSGHALGGHRRTDSSTTGDVAGTALAADAQPGDSVADIRFAPATLAILDSGAPAVLETRNHAL